LATHLPGQSSKKGVMRKDQQAPALPFGGGKQFVNFQSCFHILNQKLLLRKQ